MTKKLDMIIYRRSRVERESRYKPGFYWVSIAGIRGLRDLFHDQPLKLGQEVEVYWLPTAPRMGWHIKKA